MPDLLWNNDEMLSTAQAAHYLNVSTTRIRQLIANNQVSAERVGRSWLVSKDSLDFYQATAKNGRPSLGERAQRHGTEPREYTLMSRGHEVAKCVYDPAKHKFSKVDVIDRERVPLALRSYKVQGSLRNAFNLWWGGRCVPTSRDNLRLRLRELAMDDAFELPLRNFGLSMSDQYWLRTENDSLTWEDITYYRNAFDMGVYGRDGMAASSAGDWMNAVGLNSPDNTTDGMLRKRWIINGAGERVLIKGNGQSGREAYNEVLATKLYRRLLPSNRYVEYQLGVWRGNDVSACPTFLRDDEEFIPAWYVLQLKKKPNNYSEYRHYIETCESLGAWDARNQLDRMLVCDSILANTDRHWGNFGLIRNIETLEYRTAPIFDTGSSLWSHLSIRELAGGNYHFTTKPFYKNPNRQLDLIIDATWYDPQALEGYVEEVREYLTELFPEANPANVICRGLEQRIDQVNVWARQAPTNALDEEGRAMTEDLRIVWL